MSGASSLLVTADRLVGGDDDLRPGWVLVAGSRIVDRGVGRAPEGMSARMPAVHADTVMAGLVDIHVHGAKGVDFAQLGVDPTPAIDHHHATGTTTLVASIATGTPDAMLSRVRELRPFVTAGRLAGLHLEGPWLSDRRRGAHAAPLLRDPRRQELDALLDAADGAVRMITIAPERPGAIEAIEHLVDAGVVAALGHSDADAATTARAIDAGASVVTHLFNGMRPLHHRDPGVIGPALTRGEVAVELIADGVHVDDIVVDLVIAAASDRLILISDAMAATGLGDGEYDLAGSRVVVADGVAELADGSSLAGSTTPLGGIVSRLVARGVERSVIAAAATTRPAAVSGIDAPRLRIGDRADLVALTDGALRAMRGGRWLAS